MDGYAVYQKALADFPMRESADVGTIWQGVAMPQFVFEFWSQEIEPVVEAIVRVLDGHPTHNAAATESLCNTNLRSTAWTGQRTRFLQVN